MEDTEAEGVVTVGQRLREAREAKGLSVEDIAAQTRIPTRHLTSLEESDWDKLPAATYSIGFAKNYASAIGLDRNDIGEQLRAEMGGTRLAVAHPEVYETIDPARTMPKGLVFGALGLLLVLALLFTWLNNRSLEPEQVTAEENAIAPAENPVAPAPQAAPAAAGPVVLTATEAVWLEVKDGALTLKQGQLAPGERYEVPANAAAPVLTTGKPEALSITVGSQQAPAVGQPGRTVSGVSLKAADLMRQGSAPVTTAATPAQATPAAQRPVAPATRRQPAPTRNQTPTAPPAAPANDAAPPAAGNTADPAIQP